MATSHAAELADVVAVVATESGLEPSQDGGGMAYSVGAILVVRVAGETAEFRLRPDVAAAAARTPEAAPSPRGPEWVAFSPTTFDRFARDRITSWFEFAVRHVRDP
jgi:hypothetical protein